MKTKYLATDKDNNRVRIVALKSSTGLICLNQWPIFGILSIHFTIQARRK